MFLRCAGEKMKAEMRVSYEEREGCSRALKCRIEAIYSDTEPDFNALNQNQTTRFMSPNMEKEMKNCKSINSTGSKMAIALSTELNLSMFAETFFTSVFEIVDEIVITILAFYYSLILISPFTSDSL